MNTSKPHPPRTRAQTQSGISTMDECPEDRAAHRADLMQSFLDFLIESARLTDLTYTPTSKLERAIDKDRDHFLAWREHAPSRLRVNGPNGPFRRDRILTRGGIFSALLFRAVFFGAPILQEHEGYFEDIQAWRSVYDGHQPDTYYCDLNTYGVGVHRGVQHVEQLWEASDDLLAQLTAEVRPSFEQLWKHIVEKRAENGGMMYPTMGPLVGYLTCVDLVYAGVLTPPSLDVMGDAVAKLGKGGRDGLIRLKLIKVGAGRSEISSAFKDLYNYLEHHFPKSSSLHLDMFIVEHGLCKYKRLVKSVD